MNTVFFASLGCSKNLVDSQVMLGQLDHGGFKIIDNPSKTEVIDSHNYDLMTKAKNIL